MEQQLGLNKITPFYFLTSPEKNKAPKQWPRQGGEFAPHCTGPREKS